jgi:hypothetical protein
MNPQMRAELDESGTLMWVVEGRGMRFTHIQHWQAEVMLHYLCSSAGVSIEECQPPGLESIGVGAGTN